MPVHTWSMNEGREVAARRVPESEPARRLTDLALVRSELEHVVALSSRLESVLGATGDPDHKLTAQAFWHATLVHYARCFGEGRREPLNAEHVERVGLQNAAEFHGWLIDLRNKHIAHAVNVFEDCEVGFILDSVDDGESELTPAGIVTLVATAPLPPAETSSHVRALAEGLLRLVQEQLEQVQDEVLNDLQRRSPNELRNQPELRVGMAPPSAVRRIRR